MNYLKNSKSKNELVCGFVLSHSPLNQICCDTQFAKQIDDIEKPLKF